MNATPIAEARRALELAATAVVSACCCEGDAASVVGTSVLQAIHRFVRTRYFVVAQTMTYGGAAQTSIGASRILVQDLTNH